MDSESPKVGKQNLIAMLQDHWKGNMRGDMDANAALIAAAPDMYEALKALLDTRDKTACMVLEAQEKARKALRAAGGGE